MRISGRTTAATPIEALLGMAQQPWEVVSRTATAGFLTLVILPHLFLR
jgi:hypothetical protein